MSSEDFETTFNMLRNRRVIERCIRDKDKSMIDLEAPADEPPAKRARLDDDDLGRGTTEKEKERKKEGRNEGSKEEKGGRKKKLKHIA